MNHYIYIDISIGQTETFSITITDRMMEFFQEISGDSNPLHTDDKHAKAAGYDRKVVYGMLTASFLSTLAGMHLPGEHSLIHKIEVDFPAPVYVGDTLDFMGEVVRKDDNFKTIELKVCARNRSGQKVLRGKMRVGVRK